MTLLEGWKAVARHVRSEFGVSRSADWYYRASRREGDRLPWRPVVSNPDRPDRRRGAARRRVPRVFVETAALAAWVRRNFAVD